MKKFSGNNTDSSIYGGYISYEDTTCQINCECGHCIQGFASDSSITRCPECGRGYKTEFVVWQYEKYEE